MDWGISYQEYMNTPADIIGKLKEYLLAKNEGLRRKDIQQKQEIELKNKMPTKNN